MSTPKLGTVYYTGADADALLEGAELVNSGLRLRVHAPQPVHHSGWVRGPFDLLAAGGKYHRQLAPFVKKTVTAREVIAGISEQLGVRTLHIFNCNLLKLAALLLPGEMPAETVLREGTVYHVSVDAYERNPEARRRCIAYYGSRCSVCDFDFGEKYRGLADGFIHVHHLRPLSEIGRQYEVDPITDLRPVCPNCHAVLHLGTPPATFDELKSHIGK